MRSSSLLCFIGTTIARIFNIFNIIKMLSTYYAPLCCGRNNKEEMLVQPEVPKASPESCFSGPGGTGCHPPQLPPNKVLSYPRCITVREAKHGGGRWRKCWPFNRGFLFVDEPFGPVECEHWVFVDRAYAADARSGRRRRVRRRGRGAWQDTFLGKALSAWRGIRIDWWVPGRSKL